MTSGKCSDIPVTAFLADGEGEDQGLPILAACYLLDGGIEAVVEVGGGDHEEQS